MRFSAVRAIGADHVVDYTQEDFTWTGQGYDLILEMAGNRSLVDLRHASPSRDAGARWRIGRSVVHGDRPHPPSGGPVPVRRPAASLILVQATGADLVVLKELLEAGKLTPVIDRTVPSARLLRRSAMSASGPPKGNPLSPCEELAAALLTDPGM
jgi:NADPH:quinone reductase-like Zn-dependent oxidoreductase